VLDLAALPLDEIAARCRTESEHYRRGRSYEPHYCFELFRRALAERDNDAWHLLMSQYQRLVWQWIRVTLMRLDVWVDDAGIEDISQDAWLRLHRYIPPERFASFTGLGALVKYLRTATVAACHDWVDQQVWSGTSGLELPLRQTVSQPDPEDLEADELRAYIRACLKNDRERAVLELHFGDGLPPRVIARECPQLFRDATHVSRVIRNLQERLRRNGDHQRRQHCSLQPMGAGTFGRDQAGRGCAWC